MPQLNILVMGGHGSGKTSLAAALDRVFAEEPQHICKNLVLCRGKGEKQPLAYGCAQLDVQTYASAAANKPFTMKVQSPGVTNRTTYETALKKKKLDFTLNLTDSGLGLELEKERQDLYEQVRQSHVIIIAVDTPRLMEELANPDPQKDRKYNAIRDVTHIVKKALENNGDRRMVIFVPMKCEKYYHERRMKELNQAIKKGYGKLIEFLTGEEGVRDMTTSAIVPVMTLGGVVFHHFDENDTACYCRETKECQPIYVEHLALMCQQYLFCQAQYYKKNPKEAKLRLGAKLHCEASDKNLLEAKTAIGRYMDQHNSLAFDIFRDPLNLNIRPRLADFDILMFGSRRTGKSSVLASMVASFESLGMDLDHQIELKYVQGNGDRLGKKRKELEEIFLDKQNKGIRWVVDEDPDAASSDYEFCMTIRNSPKSYSINFRDIPGEWLKDEEQQSRLKRELDTCQIIIIAIDTPHLMEEKGKYNDACNLCTTIANLVKTIKNRELRRMFLLVPIKCEKYYHEGRMAEVQSKVKAAYDSLLKELDKRNRKRRDGTKHVVAITPILTLGGAVFDSFERNAQGVVEIFNSLCSPGMRNRPKEAYYRFYEKDPNFKPKFCEQPMLNLLCFILGNVSMTKTVGQVFLGFLGAAVEVVAKAFGYDRTLGEIWRNIFQDTKLLESAQKVSHHLKTTGDGYEFLYGHNIDKK